MSGDTILVGPGYYEEGLRYYGKNIVIISSDGAESTTISGNNSEPVIRFIDGENSTAELNGFTIANGWGTNYPNGPWGGGITVRNSDCTLNNLIIKDNISIKGGGIRISNSSSVAGEYIIISNNVSDGHGAGIFIGAGCNINLNNSTITSNIVGEGDTFGAGIYADGGTATITNSIVYYNRRQGNYSINYNLNGYTMEIMNEFTVLYSDIEGDEN